MELATCPSRSVTAADLPSGRFPALRRYLRTSVDFIGLRPRAFHSRWINDPHYYSGPIEYFGVNLLISAISGSFVIRQFVADGHPGTIAIYATSGTVLNAIAIVYAAFAAYLLVQRIRVRRLWLAFCYGTAWLPFYVPATLTSMAVIQRSPDIRIATLAWSGMALAQGFYFIYLVGALARFSGYSGPVMRSFVIITSCLTLATMTGAGVWIGQREDEADADQQPFVWNANADDRPTLSIANVTSETSCTNCWHSAIEAVPGDVIAVDVYYHQPTPHTARSVRLKLQLPTVFQGDGVIGAEVSSPDARTPANGNALLSVKASAPVRLKFIEGTWYSNGTLGRALPRSGQGIDHAFSRDGLFLGDIAPPGCGNVVIRFEVQDAAGRPPLHNPTQAKVSSMCHGQSRETRLEWTTVPTATQYMIFRGNTFLATVRSAATWIDHEATNVGSVSYGVTACDDVRCVSGPPTRVTAQPFGCTQNRDAV